MMNKPIYLGEKSNNSQTFSGICDSDNVIIKRYKLTGEEKSSLDKQV